MNSFWRWVLIIVVVLAIVGMVSVVRPDPESYAYARGLAVRRLANQPEVTAVIRFPCQTHGGSVLTEKACGFYVWKK